MRAILTCIRIRQHIFVLAGMSLLVVCSSLRGQPTLLQPPSVSTASATAPARDLVSYREVVRKVLPAVVSIEWKMPTLAGPSLRRQSFFNELDLPPEFRRFFDVPNLIDSMPETLRRGQGSGFIVDPSGVVVTNHHVVQGVSQVTIQLQDGRKFESRDIKSDPGSDLAVIRFDPGQPAPSIAFAESSAVEIGDRVLAVGAPFGLMGSVSAGIVSAKKRNPNSGLYDDWLQTDAAINPGNSGGPLVNLDGQVVGVNTAIRSSSGGSQGVGFAISSGLARSIVDKLLKNGAVARGYLGVQVRSLDSVVAERLGVGKSGEPHGVIVARVMEDSPAAKAGMQPGDIILAVAGVAIREPMDLQRRVADQPLKQPCMVTIFRDGRSQDVSVTLDEPAAPATSRNGVESPLRPTIRMNELGIEITDANGEASRVSGLPALAGAVITRVEPGSLGARAGLRPGTAISRIGETRITSAAEARASLERGSLERGLVLQIYSPEQGAGYVILKVN